MHTVYFQSGKTSKYSSGLSKLIQFETVSKHFEEDKSKYIAFQRLLEEMFPRLFAESEIMRFDSSLLMRIKGDDDSLEPIMFMNHQDVVAADGKWTHEPFSGYIDDEKIWGRGTLDTKGGLFCMLQAIEELIEEGVHFQRDIYFESSCNEETDGTGACLIAEYLKEKGIRFHMILDEGGYILYDPIGGAKGTFAMIGMGEKAYADVEFTARSNGGHASTPGLDTPLVRLGKFMAKAEKYDLFEASISPVTEEMFRKMAPYMNPILKAVLSNIDKTKAIVKRVMPKFSPAANALLRTTIAFTMAQGSKGTNVLPQEARLIANMRFSHHEGMEKGINKITRLAARYDIETKVIDRGIESLVSDPSSEVYAKFSDAVNNLFPDVVCAPYIMNGASDCRFFTELSDNCFRFIPFKISDEQLDSIHGIDENVDKSCLEGAVEFYKYLYKNM